MCWSRVLEPAYWAGRDATYSWHELKGNRRHLRVAGRRLRRLRRRCGVGTPSGIAPSGIWTALKNPEKKERGPCPGQPPRLQSPTSVIPGWDFFCVLAPLAPGARHPPNARRRSPHVADKEVTHVQAVSLCVMIDHGATLQRGSYRRGTHERALNHLKNSLAGC